MKSNRDIGFILVQLTDAVYLVIRARNDLVSGYADLNHAMGIEGPPAYTLEDIPVTVEPPRAVEDLVVEAMDRRPELLAIKERLRTAEHLRFAVGGI